MEFTYDAYRKLLKHIRDCGYQFSAYQMYSQYEKCCVLRHDIDYSVGKAYEMSILEADEKVSSTYFVLTTSDFYNPTSRKTSAFLREIASAGHDIGLHFDEVAYLDLPVPARLEKAEMERAHLEDVLECPIHAVSMHRPSRQTLEADWSFPNMINSYSNVFFREFKYLSDSRRRWREPVWDIVASEAYDRLHILTHPFWYHDQECDIHDTVVDFINSGNRFRYDFMSDNITDLPAIMDPSEVR